MGPTSVLAGRNLTVDGSLGLQTSAIAQSGSVQSGGNVTLAVGNDLMTHNNANSAGIDLEIITPFQQTINSGANLVLAIGHNLITDPGGDTTLFVNNDVNRVVNGGRILAVRSEGIFRPTI